MPSLKMKPQDSSQVPGKREAVKRKEEQKNEEQKQTSSVFKLDKKESKDAFGPDYGYKKIRFHKDDEINPYADAQDERYGLSAGARKVIAFAITAFVVFVLVSILPTGVFDVMSNAHRSIGELASQTATDFVAFLSFFTNPNSMYGSYVLTIIVTFFAGGAMALSGAVFQGSLKNALATPSTLGVTSGGQLGAILYVIFLLPSSVGTYFYGTVSEYNALVSELSVTDQLLEVYGGFICSLAGCCLIVALVLIMALVAGRGKVSNASLIIAGQVFTAVIGVVINWIREWLTYNGSEEAVDYLTSAQSTTFSGSYTVVSVCAFVIPVLMCMAAIFIMAPRLTLLAFSDEEARSMGISTVATRNIMVALCTILTALVISFCGAVGFVGFIVPHIVRRIIGPDFRYLLPTSALCGGIVVAIIYYVSELGISFIASGSTGMITSIVGSVMFLVVVLRRRGAKSGEWF